MAAAIATVVAAYVLLTLLPALGPGVATGKGNWPDAVAFLASGEGRSVAENIPFETASRSFPIGKGGLMVTFLTFIAAIFTNLVGNSFAASRIVASLSDDAALPPWFGRRNSDGAPCNAILVIAVLSVFVLALGETLVGIVVDIAITSVCVTYAYVSAAAFKIARAKRNWATMATGLFGVVVSVALMLEFFLSDLASDDGRMSALTCLILVFWCVAGQLAFYLAFRRDRNHRFGRSPLVWNALFGVIILLSLMWVRKATNDTTRNALENVVAFHTSAHSGMGEVNGDDIRKVLQTDREAMNRSIMANNLVQAGITVLSLLISFALFSVMRRRERELEREKAKAKIFFFSSVSHDIRTPLNAIIGFSEILKAGPETEAEREQAVDAILVSGKTLLGLINDVLDLSKLESGKMQIVPEPTDCPRLLRELMDAFRVSGGKPGLELRCRVGDMPPLMLDPQRPGEPEATRRRLRPGRLEALQQRRHGPRARHLPAARRRHGRRTRHGIHPRPRLDVLGDGSRHPDRPVPRDGTGHGHRPRRGAAEGGRRTPRPAHPPCRRLAGEPHGLPGAAQEPGRLPDHHGLGRP